MWKLCLPAFVRVRGKDGDESDCERERESKWQRLERECDERDWFLTIATWMVFKHFILP